MHIYHLVPAPFLGTSLIPLNQMDSASDLYKNHVSKYKGREELMDTIIPKFNCKWNDVLHFSCIDPRIIACEIKKIKPDLKLNRLKYFRIHIDQISNKHQALIYCNNSQNKGVLFQILDNEITDLTKETYKELARVPNHTIEYWIKAKQNNWPLLWFAFMPHIFINEPVDTTEFEVIELTLD